MVQNQAVQAQATNMYLWRLQRAETEKRQEDTNREILRRQHTN